MVTVLTRRRYRSCQTMRGLSGRRGCFAPAPRRAVAAAARRVKKGQTIIILEAMKMENNINADKDGKITAINVNKGDSVLEGNDLVIIE